MIIQKTRPWLTYNNGCICFSWYRFIWRNSQLTLKDDSSTAPNSQWFPVSSHEQCLCIILFYTSPPGTMLLSCPGNHPLGKLAPNPKCSWPVMERIPDTQSWFPPSFWQQNTLLELRRVGAGKEISNIIWFSNMQKNPSSLRISTIQSSV